MLAHTFVGYIATILLMEFDLGFRGLSDELLHIIGPEGRITTEHDVGDDSGWAIHEI